MYQTLNDQEFSALINLFRLCTGACIGVYNAYNDHVKTKGNDDPLEMYVGDDLDGDVSVRVMAIKENGSYLLLLPFSILMLNEERFVQKREFTDIEINRMTGIYDGQIKLSHEQTKVAINTAITSSQAFYL